MKTYLVGGAVRDELLGLEPEERDWVVVGARPEDLIEAGYRQVGSDFPVFLHPQTGEEYALARTERKSGPGYRGFEVHAAPEVTLEEDLQRRDLTINAIARTPDGVLIDPCNGRADLEQRCLRHVSPAFAEDPLRVLRVARFAAQLAHLGFTVAGETLELMRSMTASGELETLARERVWLETQKALATRSPLVYFETLRACGALVRVLPELDPLFEEQAGPRALEAAAASTPEPAERFAALVHPLDPDDALRTLSERLPIPGQWLELARLVARWHGFCAGATAVPGAELEACLAACDALRRPERFKQVLRVASIIHGESAAAGCERLQQALAVASAVDVGPLLADGWEGAELGAELRRRRIAALERLQGGGAQTAGSE